MQHSHIEPLNHPAYSNDETLRAFLPLPEGEGRGEGKVVIQTSGPHNLK